MMIMIVITIIHNNNKMNNYDFLTLTMIKNEINFSKFY